MEKAAIYRGFDRERLEREYSPSSCVGGDITAFLAAYAEHSARARQALSAQENLSYGSASDEVLDLYLPPGKGPFPLNIFIHGGYWQALSHKEAGTLAQKLAAKGIASAAINYRIAPEGTLEQMVDQCRRALTYLSQNAGPLRLDAERFTAAGHSAGAHLAAMLLTSTPAVRLKAALLIAGVYDLQPIILTSINDPLQLDARRAENLSPLRRALASHPTIKVTVGENETSEFHRQAREMALHLASQGAATSLEVHEGYNHFDIIMSDKTADEIAALTLS